jgi:hypothetical protein
MAVVTKDLLSQADLFMTSTVLALAGEAQIPQPITSRGGVLPSCRRLQGPGTCAKSCHAQAKMSWTPAHKLDVRECAKIQCRLRDGKRWCASNRPVRPREIGLRSAFREFGNYQLSQRFAGSFRIPIYFSEHDEDFATA